jgi:hypothetical protein
VFGKPHGGLLAVDVHDLPDAGGGGEGAGEDELVAADAFFFHRDAGCALQFQDGAHHDHGEPVPDHDRIGPGQIQDGMNAEGVEAFGQPGGDTPDLDDGQAAHESFPVRGGYGVPVADPVEGGVVLGPFVGQLRQGQLYIVPPTKELSKVPTIK